jgi:hypothetical protein
MARAKDTRFGMPRDEWELVRARARAFLIACARERRTTTYSELSEELKPARVPYHSYAMVALLDELDTAEDAERGVMLASLVCSKATGMPSQGYFRCAETLHRDVFDRVAYWERECERVYEAFAEGAAG